MLASQIIMRSVPESASAHLDVLRGLAAIAVVLGHLRYLFFTRFADLAVQKAWVKLIYFFCAFGHVSVIVFFVLSGFWISMGAYRSVTSSPSSSGGSALTHYAVNRLSRLYTVLIPALLLCGLLDGIGIHTPSLSYVYTHALPQFGDWIPMDRFTWPIFAGNLFFLESVTVPAFGSNAPLWSLSYEFWYYVLCPLLFVVALTRPWKPRVFSAILALALIWFLQGPVMNYSIIWSLGALAAWLGLSRMENRPRFSSKVGSTLAVLSLGGIFAVRPLYDRLSEFQVDGIVGCFMALFLWNLMRTDLSAVGLGYRKFARTLASFSYTTYLIHMPILVFIKAVWLPNSKLDPTPMGLLAGFALLLITLTICYVFSLFTERQTDRVRATAQAGIAQLSRGFNKVRSWSASLGRA